MTRTSPSRWGSQLVMWSSPVLLLVMLFSMTTSARTQHTPHDTVAANQVPTGPAPTTTATSTSTSTSTPTSTSTISYASARRRATAAAPRQPSTTRAPSSFAATTSSASSSGSDVGASATSGAVTGVLAADGVVDVPLSGPGSWTLSASAPVATRLACPRANTSFPDLVVIDSAQTCQLLITSNSASTTTWRLAPRR